MDYYEYNQTNAGQDPAAGTDAGREAQNALQTDANRQTQNASRQAPSTGWQNAAPQGAGQQNTGRFPFPSGNLFNSVIGQKNYASISGTVTDISNFSANGCTKLFKIASDDGNVTNLVIQPDTYFVDHMRIGVGMPIIAFYNANAPAPLIYPPQFQADVVALNTRWENIKVDRFNRSLQSDDGTLRLNISDSTDVVLENGQEYNGSLANRYLIVIYGSSTRSIPAQTIPKKVIVMCD